ncbi:MAG: PrgI family protein [bacterium]
MQQFTVPQFIDVEDKILGPLSVRQFSIMLAAMAVVGVCYKIFDFSMFLVIGVVVILVAGLFAFVKVAGAPFHYFLLNILKTLRKPRLRVWNKSDLIDFEKPAKIKVYKADLKLYNKGDITNKRFNDSRLSQLALVVDTRGYYRIDDLAKVKIKL